ncbi:DUF4956 domain-containing protein [Anaerocolumna cellulosilytica]|uniref:DUF4956 domain-containing protein n=1 Tax=Anaerocolumna cellulosilytica TaxID=433286 RepID=A0A6S6R0E3_9FIRM|nr:DUF4956 domain-containing protein [Anaerocolumna cellulosilytica]MBB5197766.1 putative membrane protein YhiD involved in acid resistance [Anaerocolumna cellulosilytica]BCJ93022.1 DUF4956 domain-containing protein [Anaerocolumna cellulosilytica]
MLNSILTGSLTIEIFLLCMACSVILGGIIAWAHSKCNNSSKGFVLTIALLPAIVQMVIILVNGNLGTGVAVMGAFSLVRFRSIPGNAKEITSIFIAMAIGLATGTGYLAVAGLFVAIIVFLNFIYNKSKFGEPKNIEKDLNITIPEGLDYAEIFDDLFEKYTTKSELVMVKTANMGSLYKLNYRIGLKKQVHEKAFIDELRCRNGNLEITLAKVAFGMDEL